ncbi:IPIL1 protein, partial [Rhinopomastus cyanomelas]|nr:IPIL1 protein [Rhinopomastus cyanomelas]
IFATRIQCHMEKLAHGRWVVERLMDHLLCVYQDKNSSVPMLQPAIGIGSAFEGWCPSEDEVVFRMLVPLKPPHGHDFHLELGTNGKIPATDSRICVNLKCTCNEEQLKKDTVCFIHNCETEQTTNQAPSFLSTFCTDSYLDVQKIVHWFNNNLMKAWKSLCLYDVHLCQYNISMLPTQQSCMVKLTSTCGRHFLIEIVFGVQQGDSDIFLSSQADAMDRPSTVWPQSCTVAEAKFFKIVVKKFQQGSLHLRCLHVFCRLLKGTTIPAYTVKTIVMHFLAMADVSHWHRRNTRHLLESIIKCLRFCLLKKRIDHFFIGNDSVPKEIILPTEFQRTKPVNLLEHLKNDQAAHTMTLQEL